MASGFSNLSDFDIAEMQRHSPMIELEQQLTEVRGNLSSESAENLAAQTRTELSGGAHPEDFCQQCSGPNVVWFAPNGLWNAVVRPNGEPDKVLCPNCFMRQAEAKGFTKSAWKIEQEYPQ